MKTITFLLLGLLLITPVMVNAQEEAEAVSDNPKDEVSYTFIDGIRYYYYPNLQAYFDTKEALYIQKQKDGSWTKSEKVDQTSRGYSLKNGAYVMIKGYVGDEPYSLINEHKITYPADYSTKRQPPKNHAIASN